MQQKWRVSLLGRVGAPALVAYLVIVFALTRGSVATIITLLLGLTASYLLAWRPEVILATHEVIIRNPFGVTRIPLSEILSIGGGYWGMKVRTRSGRVFVAWAIQKSNYAKWRHQQTRFDVVAATILKTRDKLRLTQT